LRGGSDFFLAFSPERVDPGNTKFTTATIPKVVGGLTPSCTRLATELYRAAIATVVPVSSTRVAEMVKLLENTFRAVNIAMVNEMALMCTRLGIDVWEVVDAAASKPFGFMPFQSIRSTCRGRPESRVSRPGSSSLRARSTARCQSMW
jgi:UDP-N-acetyl-D-glucosamine dehydrogenase